MVEFYEERRSSAALWCQRFAVFLIPFFIITILLYRFSKIDPLQMFVLVSTGLVLALLSIVFGLRAISDLWNKGYRGGSHVVRGLIITVIVLLPFGYYVFLALQHPLANDVSTDTYNPPNYVNAAQTRQKEAASGANPIMEYTDEYADLIVSSYPKIRSRRYPAGTERVLEAVRNIIGENEWRITGTVGVPESPTVSEEELANTQQETSTTLEDNVAATEDIYVEFVEETLVFGFESDVVVRIVNEAENTLVDVRSSSRLGKHDFGYNARLIQSILNQLDAALLGIAGEG